ncbi:MAG: magnesium chelatase [Phycisphaerales bacterium]|nr:magnesium chelatase [Phycisphaerales bacterium]
MSTTNAFEGVRTLRELRAAGWRSRSVKAELRENLIAALRVHGTEVAELFPGIIGYESTVIPEIINAILAGHDMLFLGEKGQGKSRLMRQLGSFLDPFMPYLDIDPDSGDCPVHEDPERPITRIGRDFLARHGESAPIAWWPRENRYAERLAPGTKFADVIGEIDPAKLARGVSLGAEESLFFGMIPRMHRGIFAMNELPDLDDSVQVGLFNILEERDVQIRGLPVRFDLDLVVLFSANPSTYNRSGKVIPQLKDRIGSTIQTHYPRQRDQAIDITEQEALKDLTLGGDDPVIVPRFMKEIVEEMASVARKSKYVDHASGVSARFSIANYRVMVASARRRGITLGERPSVPRISDLAHFHATAAGKVELDLMSSHQLTETQALDAIFAEAIRNVFKEYVQEHGLAEIAEIFAKGVRIEVGDMLPSSHYEGLLRRVPPVWDKAFEVNASGAPEVRASCVEFVLAGLWASDMVSRAVRHGRVEFET